MSLLARLALQAGAVVAGVVPAAVALSAVSRAVDVGALRWPSANAADASFQAKVDEGNERIMQQQILNNSLFHYQLRNNVNNQTMWQNFYRQQDMIRSMRY